MQITITVPNDLGRKLEQVHDRLPQLLAGVLDEWIDQSTEKMDDEQAIIRLLVSQPSPQQVLTLRPSPKFQARISQLTRQRKQGTISPEAERELERYRHLEHLVRLAKIYAAERLSATT